MAPNFKELFRKNMDDVKKPEPLPEGSYRGLIRDYTFGETPKKTPYIEFGVIPQEALEGVDQAELEASLQGSNLADKKLRFTQYITENSLFMVKGFLQSLGLDTQGRTLDELIPETRGQSIIFQLAKVPNKQGDGWYNNITEAKGEHAED